MSLNIAAIGLATAFGAGWGPLRAGLAEDDLPFFRRRDFIGSDYRAQTAAFQPETPLEGAPRRIRALLAQALTDLAAQIEGDLGPDLALILMLPDLDDPALRPDNLLADLGWPGRMDAVTVLCPGQGGISLSLSAVEEITKGNQPVVLCCADSFADRDRLNPLLSQQALFSKATPFGLIPGEAAGAVLFAPKPVMGGLSIIARGEAIEAAPESACRDSDFAAMAAAAHQALDALPFDAAARPEISRIISDWNNSRYRAAELSYCLTRLTPFCQLGHADPLYPAQLFGETGAAWLAVVLAMFCEDPGQTALALSGNHDDGRRSALFLQKS